MHYASADLFFSPSLTETFGNLAPEAMASALRVVAFDDAAIRAAIVSDVNGVTVGPNDRVGRVAAAVRTAQDRVRPRAMGVAARRAVEGMRWERVLVDVVERLLEVVRRRSIEGAYESVAGAAE